jgi:TusE/DsrC/DsvC family sulfur relay protein
MRTFVFQNHYRVDTHGFLLDGRQWDEGFVRAMAPSTGIPGELTEPHWQALYFVRNTFDKMTACPLLYIAFQRNDLGIGDLKELFPSGYLKSVCKLAGITYREAKIQQTWIDEHIVHYTRLYERKEYPLDEHGFLHNPADWDECFAVRTAAGWRMNRFLTETHWQVIYFLRKGFIQDRSIPKAEAVAAALGLDVCAIAALFPDGYDQGALKIAGLKNGVVGRAH